MCYGFLRVLIKDERSSPSYSSSGGNSSNPWRAFFCETGPFASRAFFLAAAAISSSVVVRLKRSNTRSVSIESNPEFCCVTTELAMFSLKRCNLVEKLAKNISGVAAALPHDLFF